MVERAGWLQAGHTRDPSYTGESQFNDLIQPAGPHRAGHALRGSPSFLPLIL
jgi:hypothetical protein